MPRRLPVQNIGSAPNRVECAAGEANEKAVASRALHSPRDVPIEQVLAQHPAEPSNWGDYKIHLSHSGQTMARICARPRTILVPWRAHLGAIFFDGHFAE